VLRLLGLGCGGATLAHASLEAGHAGPYRIRRPGGRFGHLILASCTAAADGAWHEVSPRNPSGQPCL